MNIVSPGYGFKVPGEKWAIERTTGPVDRGPLFIGDPRPPPNNGRIGHSTSPQTHDPAGVLAGGYTVCIALRIVRVAGDLFSV